MRYFTHISSETEIILAKALQLFLLRFLRYQENSTLPLTSPSSYALLLCLAGWQKNQHADGSRVPPPPKVAE